MVAKCFRWLLKVLVFFKNEVIKIIHFKGHQQRPPTTIETYICAHIHSYSCNISNHEIWGGQWGDETPIYQLMLCQGIGYKVVKK